MATKRKKMRVTADRLSPPMTAKERAVLRKVTGLISAGAGAFQFAEDPGVRSMAFEVQAIFGESTTRLVQAYRDGKEQ